MSLSDRAVAVARGKDVQAPMLALRNTAQPVAIKTRAHMPSAYA
jgi:hypothetical protein